MPEFRLVGTALHTSAFHYAACGLSDVYLLNGVKFDDDLSLSVQFINDLHAAIGLAVIQKKEMNGEDFKFLRTEMGFNQNNLASFLNVTRSMVTNCEISRDIPKSVQQLLRVLYAEHCCVPIVGHGASQRKDHSFFEAILYRRPITEGLKGMIIRRWQLKDSLDGFDSHSGSQEGSSLQLDKQGL